MGLALIGVMLGAAVLLLWLRSLRPDGAARPLAGTAAATSVAPSQLAARQPAARAAVKAVPHPSDSTPFSAVSIKPGANACKSAGDLSKLRFLRDSAPMLPLDGCDCLPCDCGFQRHLDRRSNQQGERRSRAGEENSGDSSGDRRMLHGRRITDHC
jgi:hypothetical protein